jgi:hypothetical protein
MSTEEPNNNQALIDAVRDGYKPVELIVTRGDARQAAVLAVPKGNGSVELVPVKQFVDAYAHLERPEYINGTAVATTLDSFIDLVKRYATPESAIFAKDDPASPSITCVIDYHSRRQDMDGALVASEPAWGRHKITYAFPLSPQWLVWRQPQANLTQEAFARFLEDHLDDVVNPAILETVGPDGERSKTLALCDEMGIRPCSRKELMLLAKGLEARIEQEFVEKRNLDTGEVKLVFQETVKGEQGTPLEVPNGFLVLIPIFRGGDSYVLPIRLRFKPVKPNVKWEFTPFRIEQALRDAFALACSKASKEADLPLFYGSPESAR